MIDELTNWCSSGEFDIGTYKDRATGCIWPPRQPTECLRAIEAAPAGNEHSQPERRQVVE